jgi:hypothetical protein
VARFGDDIALPDLLVDLASCESPTGLYSALRCAVQASSSRRCPAKPCAPCSSVRAGVAVLAPRSHEQFGLKKLKFGRSKQDAPTSSLDYWTRIGPVGSEL